MTGRMFLHAVGIAALLTSRFSVVVANTSFDLAEECSDEVASCSTDSTCSQCFSDLATVFESTTSFTTTEFSEECLSGYFDDGTTSLTTCDVYGAIECCYSDDCFANDAFLSLWECAVEGVGCSTESFSCDETSTAAATGTLGASGFSHLVCAIVLVFTSVHMMGV